MQLKHSTILAGITLIFVVGMPAISLLHTRGQTPRTATSVDSNFDTLVKNQFQKFSMPPLNVSKASSVIAIPMEQSPVDEMKDLERWTTIGGLYVPSGSARLQLPPGAYRVLVIKSSGGGKARFTDDKGEVHREVPADIEPADAVEIPYATDEHSVCWRMDKTRVCV